MGVAVTGWGSAVPETVVSNADIGAQVDVEPDWIFQRTGITSRHIAADGQKTSELATDAARRALGVAGADAEMLDAIIVATVTPDLQIPATASLVQSSLGARRAAAFDLNAGCSGFLYALSQATAMVVSGQARRVLVVGADILSRVIDFSDPRSAVLFGDGAGAVVVERSIGRDRIGPFLLGSDGSEPDLLCIPRSTGLISMQGREVYRRAVEAMSDSIRDLSRAQGIELEEIDLVVCHQANARILASVADRTGLPEERFLSNISSYGNTSAASIPLALAEAADGGRLGPGDLVVLAAFGAGFTWGAGLVRWGEGTSDAEHRRVGALADA
ncbi:MAG: beta-ketoacyl-ACP synthase III [Actinomycetota bacterium]